MKAVLETFPVFVDNNSSPNGQKEGSHGPTYYNGTCVSGHLSYTVAQHRWSLVEVLNECVFISL